MDTSVKYVTNKVKAERDALQIQEFLLSPTHTNRWPEAQNVSRAFQQPNDLSKGIYEFTTTNSVSNDLL